MALKTTNNFLNLFFGAIFIVVFYLFVKLFWSYLGPFILALILATVFYNWYEWISRRLKGRESLSAAIMCLAVLLFVGIPTGIFIGLITNEAIGLISFARNNINEETIKIIINNQWIQEQLSYLSRLFNVDLSLMTISSHFGDIGKKVGLFIYSQGTRLTANLFTAGFNLALLFFIMFYFFRDGKKFLRRIMDISPLSDKQELNIVKTFSEVGSAVFFGNLVSAMLQGFIGGLGCAVFGIGKAALLGFAIAIFSLIPTVGTLVVYIPATIFLAVAGNIYVAGGYFIYNLIFSNLIDNIIKPKLIENKIKIHPLLVFFSIIGGVRVFGLLGILYGPLIVTIFLTVLHIYEEDFKDKKNGIIA